MKWYAESRLSFHKSLLSGSCRFFFKPDQRRGWRRGLGNRRQRVKWKICAGTMKWLLCKFCQRRNSFLYWGAEGGGIKWRMHPRRINVTSIVFFFVMHHYEAVKLSARRISAAQRPAAVAGGGVPRRELGPTGCLPLIFDSFQWKPELLHSFTLFFWGWGNPEKLRWINC